VVLKPFEEVTKVVSGENYMSASLVIILYKGLKDDKMYLKNFDTNITQVIFDLQNGLQKRFSNLEMSNTQDLSSFHRLKIQQLKQRIKL